MEEVGNPMRKFLTGTVLAVALGSGFLATESQADAPDYWSVYSHGTHGFSTAYGPIVYSLQDAIVLLAACRAETGDGCSIQPGWFDSL